MLCLVPNFLESGIIRRRVKKIHRNLSRTFDLRTFKFYSGFKFKDDARKGFIFTDSDILQLARISGQDRKP